MSTGSQGGIGVIKQDTDLRRPTFYDPSPLDPLSKPLSAPGGLYQRLLRIMSVK
jgi:hypothetical protein